MADQVQATMDRMVPALRDFLDRGIFTESETKAIVSRRRESEYLLSRHTPRKADYQRYIDDEKRLEKLRALRKKMVMSRQEAKEREQKKLDNDANEGKGNNDANQRNEEGNFKGSFADASIVQNIHLLYTRAKRKWKEDMVWHLQHAEFAKQAKSYQMLSRIYAEALQIHPRNESLWIEAASHEYFGYIIDEKTEGMSGGGSIKSARVLLQRGLRINNNAKALWLQSFCLELHYVQKMRGRREILQLQSDITENDDNVDNAEVENGLVIPQIVYKNAIKAIPDDTSFRLNFIEQCKLFPLTESLIEIIVETIENDFQNVEDVWITRAGFILEKEHACQSHASEENDSSTRKRKRIKKDNNQTCDSVLRKLMEAIETIKTPEMFRQVLSFLRLNISTLCNGHHNESTDDSLIVKQRMTSIIEFVVHVINEVQATVDIVPDLAIEMAESLVELGLLNQSFELMKNLTSNKTSCRTNPKCWLKLVELSESIGNEDDDIKTMNKSCAFMKMALKVIPLHDPGHVDILSKLFMTLLSKSTLPSHFDELSIVYDKILLLHVQKKNDPSTLAIISLAYLRYAKQKKDINFIRQLYSKLLLTSSVCKTPCVSLENAETMKKYFDECINAETSQLGKHTKMKKHFVTQIYDVASKYFSLVDDKSACYYNQKKREMSTS